LINYFFLIEKEKRFVVFKENLNRIEELNEQEEGTAIYGITHLSDLNGLLFFFFSLIILNFVEEEFTQYYLNERLAFSKHISQPILSLKDPLKVSPEAFDWRNYSAVTDVKNQVNKFNLNYSFKTFFLLLL
jgi:cathepsin F